MIYVVFWGYFLGFGGSLGWGFEERVWCVIRGVWVEFWWLNPSFGSILGVIGGFGWVECGIGGRVHGDFGLVVVILVARVFGVGFVFCFVLVFRLISSGKLVPLMMNR